MTLDHGRKEYGWNSAEATPDHAYTLPGIVSLLPSSSRGG